MQARSFLSACPYEVPHPDVAIERILSIAFAELEATTQRSVAVPNVPALAIRGQTISNCPALKVVKVRNVRVHRPPFPSRNAKCRSNDQPHQQTADVVHCHPPGWRNWS